MFNILMEEKKKVLQKLLLKYLMCQLKGYRFYLLKPKIMQMITTTMMTVMTIYYLMAHRLIQLMSLVAAGCISIPHLLVEFQWYPHFVRKVLRL